MGFWEKAKEIISYVSAYSQGVDTGEEWVEGGGGPVSDALLQKIQADSGIELSNPYAFNDGFKSVSGSTGEEEEE